VTTPDPRALPRLLSAAGGPGLGAHFQRWGQMPGGGPLLIEEVDRAGLRGRGGAGFPTAVKLRAVASARHGIVVANGTEGEPASGKDKVLLQTAPHLVLDGASIAAETVGAGEAVICVDRTARAAIRALQDAITERAPTGADRVTSGWRRPRPGI
jgi:NADH:ubiquinone oxidoreductase subunit F (NADH-binding)